MRTLTDASDRDFRVRRRKETTDSRQEEEFRKSERERTEEKTPNTEWKTLGPGGAPNAENTDSPQEGRTERREVNSLKNPGPNASEPSHGPGGSWLSKVRSFIGLRSPHLYKREQGKKTGDEGRAGVGNRKKGTGFAPRALLVRTKKESDNTCQ
ncbi:hypothetical protein NDU88_002005 [Pleurodeles waltl]|uniref:Uncharacterized protein n=1 Tax=Pleurodeles waltl TaxID=8319 RepID=A0AAV7SBG4_PLEWA|nr:hypothetical protein NDU88_002005 [Pleurodeles waltl]